MHRSAYAWIWGSVFLWSADASAIEANCTSPLARSSVVPCALELSLAVRSAGDVRRALTGRRTAALPIFPSNPMLAASIGRRITTSQPTATNWYVSLSQEIEIGGQRGFRLDAADADLDANAERTRLVQRDAIADTYLAYFEVLGARAELDVAKQLEDVSRDLSRAAVAAADHGLASGVDADLAEAAGFRSTQARIAAEGRVTRARVSLATRLGVDPVGILPDAAGDLVPLDGVVPAARIALGSPYPEVVALQDEKRAWDARASAFRRAAVPNVTLSFFVQEDGFQERVLGLGLALPIPFPQPIGRTYLGEAREAQALADRSATDAERVERERRGSVVRALADYETLAQSVDAIPIDRIDRAKRTLASIAQEVAAGRLAIRDAVLAQQTFTALLLDYQAAKRALCIASVELARAASLPLERGGR